MYLGISIYNNKYSNSNKYLFIFVLFYQNLSSFHDIETNCGMAMKATLLINSLRIAFYLLAFDVRHLCKGYGRMQLRALSLQGPPQIAY